MDKDKDKPQIQLKPSEFTREVESFGRNITLIQSDDGGIGGTIWDASLVLAKYFENVEDFPVGCFARKRVLELGGGTGLLGIVLSRLGANVHVTDVNENVLEMARRSAQANYVNPAQFNAEVLNWNENNDKLKEFCAKFGPFDYVIGSDLAYNLTDYDALVSTINCIFNSGSGMKLILAHELRDRNEAKFFDALRKSFKISKVEDEKLDETFRSDDIGVFVGSPLSSSL